MKDKMYFVVNPVSAAKTTQKEWPIYEKLLREKGYTFEVGYTQYPEHAIQLTREALNKGYTLIVSVGGDGTMNEVINGFFIDKQPINAEAKLAIFSRGTGCDFIKTLEIKKDIYSFLDLLSKNETMKCDVGYVKFVDYKGQIKDKYFLNVADIGIGGETTYRVNRTSKVLKGFLSFLIGAVISIVKYRNKKFYINIDDEIIINEKLNSVIISNGKYFGGGMKVAPNAALDDGVFDIIVFGNLSKIELISKFPMIYKGTHLEYHKLKQYRGQKVTVKCEGKALIEIDGEQPGTADAEFVILPKSIKLLKLTV